MLNKTRKRKAPEENMRKLLYKLGVGKAFLTMTATPEVIK